MIARLFKPLAPRGLYGRAALILVVPIVTIQLVVSIVFIQRHFERVTAQMTANVVDEAAFVRRRIDAAPDLDAALAAAAAVAGPLNIDLRLPAPPVDGDRRDWADLSGRSVIATLRAGLPELVAVDLASDDDRVRFTLATRHGPAELQLDRDRVSATNPHQLLVLMIVTGVMMTLIAFLFLRNQVRPINELARVSEAFGRGRHLPYRVRGAREVRAAGRAFLDMRARIERQIEQRTLLLSGVSHDLRTPITRLRLELSMLDEDETVDMRRDLDEMALMLDRFLDFARGDAMEEPEPVDPRALLDAAVDDARRGGMAVHLVSADDGPPVSLRPQAVGRALANLVANGARYGDRAEVRLHRTDGAVRFVVEDDGPGIPEDRIDEALRPFTRLDAARNQDRGGGVGLGLAITADIARAHGGRLTLGRSATLGGLRAEIVLPV